LELGSLFSQACLSQAEWQIMCGKETKVVCAADGGVCWIWNSCGCASSGSVPECPQ